MKKRLNPDGSEMTEQQIKEHDEQRAEIVAAMTEAIRAASPDLGSEEAINSAAARAVDSYLEQHKTLPGILGRVVNVQVEGKDAPKKDRQFFGKLVNDMIAIREGRRPEFGTDFEAIEKQRAEYAQRTGVTHTTASQFIPTEHSTELIDLTFRDGSFLSRCRRRAMRTDQVTITTLAGGVTLSWTPAVTDVDAATDQASGLKPHTNITPGLVTLTKYTAHVFVKITRKMLRISDPSVEDAIRVDAPACIDAGLSKAVLQGTATAASDPISGLASLITTNSIPYADANPRGSLLKFLMAPGFSHGPTAASNLVIMGAHGMQFLLDKRDSVGRPLDLVSMNGGLMGAKTVLGVPMLEMYGLGTTGNVSPAFAGNFGLHANIGIDDSMFILVDPYSELDKNIVRIMFEINFAFAPSAESCFSMMNIPILA